MQEILALNRKLTALLGAEHTDEVSYDFSRVDDSKNLGELPPELRDEIEALRAAINEAVPAEFEYYAFLTGEAGPAFDLEYARVPVGPDSDEFDPERSILEHIRALDWEAEKQKASAQREQWDEMFARLELLRLFKPLPSTKESQKAFAEETKDFIREKRREADKIHLMTWDAKEKLMEYDFATGEELRRVLPDMIRDGLEVIAVVAFGKPLPVKSIDALKAEAQKAAQERLKAIGQEEQAKLDAGGGGEGGIIRPPTKVMVLP